MIAIATLLCDRKASSQIVGLSAAMKLDATGIEGGLRYYINVETRCHPENFVEVYEPLLNLVDSNEGRVECDIDHWIWQTGRYRNNFRHPPWRIVPQYDQDQRRLQSICMARNMAREFALVTGATHLFFVDADVIVPPDALKRLLALDHPLAGGLVPGRGAHSHVHYLFGISSHPVRGQHQSKPCEICGLETTSAIHSQPNLRLTPNPVPGRPGVLEVEHGTCGCLLIRRDLLSTLAFRSGLDRTDMKTGISEDPAYAKDAFLNGFGRWWIDTNVRCQHIDDPNHPLTGKEVSRDYEIPK